MIDKISFTKIPDKDRVMAGFHKPGAPLQEIGKGIAAGVIISGVALVALQAIAWLTSIFFTATTVPDIIAWCATNLRLSIIPFTVTLILFALALKKLGKCLDDPQCQPHDVAQAEHLADIWINCFFGIGVIWTAIGMRSALLSGLAGLDAAAAQELGAFTILQRLVEGGILLALSTTIVGGIGGYIMRIYKAIGYGTRLRSYYAILAQKEKEELLESLSRIENSNCRHEDVHVPPVEPPSVNRQP